MLMGGDYPALVPRCMLFLFLTT